VIQNFLDSIRWMQWTLPSLIFFGGIFLVIAIVGIAENYIPIVARKGFLPIPTTPGDRVFISIMYIIGLFLIWLAIFNANLLFIPIILIIVGVILIALYG
jgi:predicted small integral membrane protein